MKEFSAKRFMCGRLCNTAITEHHPAATVELSSHTRGRESETGWRHLQVLVGGKQLLGYLGNLENSRKNLLFARAGLIGVQGGWVGYMGLKRGS